MNEKKLEEGFESESFKVSLKNAVCRAIDEMPYGFQFYGWELKQRVCKYYPACKNSYVDTIMRQMRKYRRASVKCVKPNVSLYEKTAVKTA